MKSNFFKKLKFVFLVATLIVFIGYGALFYFIRELNIDVADASVSHEERERLLNIAKSLEKTLENLNEEIDVVNRSFIDSDGSIDFIEYIEDLGKKTDVGILIKDVNESDAVDIEKKSELRFKVAIQGEWKHVYRFLAILENAPNIIVFESVELRKNISNEYLVSDAFQAPKNSGVKLVTSAWRGDFEFTVLKNK